MLIRHTKPLELFRKWSIIYIVILRQFPHNLRFDLVFFYLTWFLLMVRQFVGDEMIKWWKFFFVVFGRLGHKFWCVKHFDCDNLAAVELSIIWLIELRIYFFVIIIYWILVTKGKWKKSNVFNWRYVTLFW